MKLRSYKLQRRRDDKPVIILATKPEAAIKIFKRYENRRKEG